MQGVMTVGRPRTASEYATAGRFFERRASVTEAQSSIEDHHHLGNQFFRRHGRHSFFHTLLIRFRRTNRFVHSSLVGIIVKT